jgi:hypothetical protein
MKAPRYLRGARSRSLLWFPRAIGRKLSTAAVGLLDRIVAKQPRRVVLGSDKALKFNGNPRSLFEHLAGKPGWDAWWLTSSPEVLRQVNKRFPGRALPAWSWKALRMGLTAQWLGFSHSRYDLGWFAYLIRPRFIYLNHGVPLKTMGFAKAYHDPAVGNAARGMGAITCCSQVEAELWARAYGLPLNQMWITGTPRNDRLFEDGSAERNRLSIAPGQKVILYAPTYRETGPLDGYLPVPGLNVEALVEQLSRHDGLLLVRPHYYEWSAANAMVERIGSSRIRLADESVVPDVNDLLPVVDILITDYSSIYFDFLLLDRPMIFSCHDLEDYIRDRGLMMDYDLNTPGPKVRTAEQFLEQLELTLRGDDPARGLRGKLREKFHRFPDAHSAERIAQRIAGEL